ncbi:hypothetical protein LDENG_00276120 [Lucifuga dentata]|nr:hypothetical protein LDENG_00276120 [Lucifuga dentata]
MHWLPLVAMVIASALPFPHNPVSRIAAATPEPGLDNLKEDRRESASRLATPTEPHADYDFHGNASQQDDCMATAGSQDTNRQNHQNQKDYVKSSINEELSTEKAKSPKSYQTDSDSHRNDISLFVPTEGGRLRPSDIKGYSYISEDNTLPKDYKAEGSKRDDTSFADFPKKDDLQDSVENRTERNDIRPLQLSVPETHSAVSPGASLHAQRGPELTSPSEQPRDAATVEVGGQWMLRGRKGLEPAEESLEAGLGLGTGLDSLQEGDEMFLDAHPRVLFSPSPLPPDHPPLLLMLESGMLPEEGDGEEQEDVDGHIEGHGDRAIDRSGPQSWAVALRGANEVDRPVKRNKRSHLIDTRRGERSVCESESVWVTDKKTAIDSHGRTVTILQEIQTQTGPLKQYFYETRCRGAEQPSYTDKLRGSKDASGTSRSAGVGVARSGCLGVDKKQWVSECKAKQSFVRALTKDANNRIGWRWIRLDSSCVCVLLSRANRQWGGRA